MIKKTSFFLISLPVIYLVLIFALSNLGFRGKTLMDLSTRNPVTPGEFGYSYQRFRDIQNYRNVDILFLGSSHCYRTFDNRIFAEQGFSSFNMGSPNQTPLNTYHLLKRYVDQLKPRLVIFELYSGVIDRDGLESFYDLSANVPFCRELVEMAFAVESPHAVNDAFSRGLLHLTGLTPETIQKEMPGEAYVPGGYVEQVEHSTNSHIPHPDSTHLAEPDPIEKVDIVFLQYQLDYIEKIIRTLQQRNIGIILVTQPVTERYRSHINNYDEIAAQLIRIAGEYNLTYIDFNRHDMKHDILHDYWHYDDVDHLNADGVRIFNELLIRTLREKGFLSALMKQKRMGNVE